jgi:hypothetical protein
MKRFFIGGATTKKPADIIYSHSKNNRSGSVSKKLAEVQFETQTGRLFSTIFDIPRFLSAIPFGD